MPEKYKPRSYLNRDKLIFGTKCECGHYKHNHDLNPKRYICFILSFGLVCLFGDCENCMCPNYHTNIRWGRV